MLSLQNLLPKKNVIFLFFFCQNQTPETQMLIRKPPFAWVHQTHLRHFSLAPVHQDRFEAPSTPLLEYLPGFPKPDPKYSETIHAIHRVNSGKNMSAKERKAGRVPSIVFEQEDGQLGGNKRLISLHNNQIKKLVNQMGQSFFLSRVYNLEVRPEFESDEVIEKLHLHSGNDAVLNVTFIRAPSSALLKVDIPLVFRGEDVSPGLKKGAYLNIIKRTVKYLCPPDVIPPYIDVDVSELDVGQKLSMGDLKVHPALKLVRSENELVCKINGSSGIRPEEIQINSWLLNKHLKFCRLIFEPFELCVIVSGTIFVNPLKFIEKDHGMTMLQFPDFYGNRYIMPLEWRY